MSNKEDQKSWAQKVEENPVLFTEAIEALLISRVGSFVFINESNLGGDLTANGLYYDPDGNDGLLAKIIKVENNVSVSPESSAPDNSDYVVSGHISIIARILRFDGGKSLAVDLQEGYELTHSFSLTHEIESLEDNELCDVDNNPIHFLSDEQLLAVHEFVKNAVVGLGKFSLDLG